MNILIVAATYPEIKTLLSSITGHGDNEEFSRRTIQYHQTGIDVVITGVGLMHTAHFMGRVLASNTYDVALNFGIAGSFSKNISIGDVVHVVEERVADLGAENGEDFLDVIELQLLNPDQFPYKAGKLIHKTDDVAYGISDLKKVKGISVNKVHGCQHSIDNVIQKYHPDIESMEGAAFFYSCLTENVPCLQIRAISNYIEDRNKDTWNIPLAIKNLNRVALKIIHHVTQHISV